MIGRMPAPRRDWFRTLWPSLLAGLWGAIVACGVLWGRLPAWVGWAVLGLCVVAFALHGWDKWRAQRQARRVPEALLHTLELLGGWPGALVARHLFRHKTVKFGYRVLFCLCAATNVAVLGGILWFHESFGALLPGAAVGGK